MKTTGGGAQVLAGYVVPADGATILVKGGHVPPRAHWSGNPATEVPATTAPQVRAPASAKVRSGPPGGVTAPEA